MAETNKMEVVKDENKEQLNRIFAEKFQSVDDIISDGVFRSQLTKFMGDMVYNRTTREAPPEGKKWVRDWLDTLIDKGVDGDNHYIDEIERVLLKKSNMSSGVRGNLYAVAHHCIHLACVEYLENEPTTADQ